MGMGQLPCKFHKTWEIIKLGTSQLRNGGTAPHTFLTSALDGDEW